jgi:hypothetical protein
MIQLTFRRQKAISHIKKESGGYGGMLGVVHSELHIVRENKKAIESQWLGIN